MLVVVVLLIVVVVVVVVLGYSSGTSRSCGSSIVVVVVGIVVVLNDFESPMTGAASTLSLSAYCSELPILGTSNLLPYRNRICSCGSR